MAMTVELPALEQAAPPRRRSFWLRGLVQLRRLARPGLGLLLPVGLALGWELYVALGYSNGRLVPPPTKVFATIAELARSGELSRHIIATLYRVFAGFGLGVVAGTLLGAISGYWGLARRLLNLNLRRLAGLGARAVFLEVGEHNDPALRLYHRAGFREVSRRTNYYPGHDGGAAALVLRRDL